MSNKPKILLELAPHEASYFMDLLHADWARRVAGYTITAGMAQQPDEHVRQWLKHRPSRLMHYMDSTAERQGFWENGVGL